MLTTSLNFIGALAALCCLRKRWPTGAPFPAAPLPNSCASTTTSLLKLLIAKLLYVVSHCGTLLFSTVPGRLTKLSALSNTRKRNAVVCCRALSFGAEADGELGLVSAPRDRLLVLMLCTAELARRGWATPKLLSLLLGCWIHALMFRRPAMCVLDCSFAEAAQLPANRVRRLPRRVRNELSAVAALGPLLQTDLRVAWCPELFCMDASPTGAGLCSAPSTVTAVRELWRLSEQRGFYTKLEAPSSAALRELGHDSSVPYTCSGDASASLFPLPRALTEGVLYDCLEVAFCDTGWSTAHRAVGLSFHPWSESELCCFHFSLLGESSVFSTLSSLAARGVVRDWHFCPPTSTFASRGLRRFRSSLCPAGLGPACQRVLHDNRFARCVAFLCCLVASAGCFFSVHQPRQSLMFELHCFRRLLRSGAHFLVGVPVLRALPSKVLPPGSTISLGCSTLLQAAFALPCTLSFRVP